MDVLAGWEKNHKNIRAASFFAKREEGEKKLKKKENPQVYIYTSKCLLYTYLTASIMIFHNPSAFLKS